VPGLGVGFGEGVATFDANGDFVSFQLIKHAGQLPAVCPQIIAALSQATFQGCQTPSGVSDTCSAELRTNY
jgi:hypothetical protein